MGREPREDTGNVSTVLAYFFKGKSILVSKIAARANVLLSLTSSHLRHGLIEEQSHEP